MTDSPDPDAGPSTAISTTGPLAATLAGLLLAVTFLGFASTSVTANGAYLGGAALLGATLAATWSLSRSRSPRPDGSTLFVALAHAAATTAVAIHAGFAIPEDLHLFTLGRPPHALGMYLAVTALLAIDGTRTILGSRSPRAAFVPLLVACAALEGLPLATPPWSMLGVAAIAFLSGAASSPRRWSGVPIACAAVAIAYAIAGALGADPGTSLDPTLRVTALSLTAFVIAGEGRVGARRAIGTLLGCAIAIGSLAVITKVLLTRATSGLEIDALGSELSLFGRHPNALAPWFGATAILAIAAVRSAPPPDGDRRLRIAGWFAIPFAIGSLLLTASRLAIGATIVAAILGLVLRTRAGRRGVAIGAGVLAAGLVLALGALSIPPLRAKLVESFDARASLDHRAFRMRVGIASALENPVLGRGPACWFTQGPVTPRSRFEGETSEDHPHCLPIAVFQGAGLLGIAALAALLVATALAARRAMAADTDGSDAVLATGALLASVTQLSTNLLDMGDALSTLIPSRLPIDAAVIAALVPTIGSAAKRRGSVVSIAIGVALGLVALHVGFVRTVADSARNLAREGFTERSLLAFERAEALLPFDAATRLDHARVAFAAKKRVVARDAIEAALRIAPARPDAHEALAALRLALDDRVGAREAARHALALDPHGATSRRLGLLLAELDLDAGDDASAMEMLALTVRVDALAFAGVKDPERADSLRLGRHVVPLHRVYDALRASLPEVASPREAMRVDLRILELALGAKDLDTAEAALAAYRVHDPTAISIDKFEGKLRLAQGRFDDALSAFDRAASKLVDPGLLADRGDALLAAGRVDDAIDAYRAAMPSARDVYFHAYAYHGALTRLASALERDVEANRAALEEVLSSLEFFVAADLDRALVLVRLARVSEDATRSQRALKRALFAVLRCDDSPAVRSLASEIGAALAATNDDPDGISAFADDLEREALSRNAGAPTHVFRAALLAGLKLTRRAADAERDVLAFPR